jgi:hypothetical protein
MRTTSPVFGLRPVRSPFRRVEKSPERGEFYRFAPHERIGDLGQHLLNERTRLTLTNPGHPVGRPVEIRAGYRASSHITPQAWRSQQASERK